MFSDHAHVEMGKLIKTARTNAKLTQAQLAAKLGYSSPQFISNWERAESLPPISTLPKIAKVTKTDYKKFRSVLLEDFTKTLDNPSRAAN